MHITGKNFFRVVIAISLAGFYQLSNAVDGQCVAFCDDPPAPQSAPSGNNSDYYFEPEYTQPPVDNSALADEYNDKGIAARAAGNYRQAIEYYNESLEP